MGLALGRRLSIEQIEKKKNGLLEKNQELLEKWKEQQLEIRSELRAKQKSGQLDASRRA
jgi:hypothetical protein